MNEPEAIRGTHYLDSRDVCIQVEWDGQGVGHMSVEAAEGQWRRLTHIHTQPRVNDVLVTRKCAKESRKTFKVTFQRCGEHPESRFWVKAIPIHWTKRPATLPAAERATFVAKFGEHYTYDSSERGTSDSYKLSALEGGAQCATIELDCHRAYELWAKLQNPHDLDDWLELDPIVDDGPGNGGGGNPN